MRLGHHQPSRRDLYHFCVDIDMDGRHGAIYIHTVYMYKTPAVNRGIIPGHSPDFVGYCTSPVPFLH